MNIGQISDTIYDRTVYKTILNHGFTDKSLKDKGQGLGTDCAIFPVSFGMASDRAFDMASCAYSLSSTSVSYGTDAYVVTRAVIDSLNKIYVTAKDPQDVTVTIDIGFPAKLREAKLRAMIEEAAAYLAGFEIPILNLDAHIEPEIANARVTAHAHGHAHADLRSDCGDRANILFEGGARPNQDIVMTKYIGLEGSAVISAMKARELTERFPANIIETACNFKDLLSIRPEAAGAMRSDACTLQVVREGGIFGALWNLARKSGVGLVVDLKKIPVRQETIEICEYYDINPYELCSGGSLLIVTDKGNALVSELSLMGIEATVIGQTTEGNDKIIKNDDETRYLDPPKGDAIYQVIYNTTNNQEGAVK